MRPRQLRTRTRTSRVLGALANGPATLHLIAVSLQMVESRVRYTLDQLRDEKLVYIGGWVTVRTRTVPIYFLGSETEVMPPRGARLQFLTNGYNYRAGSHLTAISVLWLVRLSDDESS